MRVLLLGAALAVFMFNWGTLGIAHHRNMLPTALFMGAAMSVTAFPVLARIMTERRLHKTEVGAITIACAAFDDLTAWVMLAFVVGVAHQQLDGMASGRQLDEDFGLAGSQVDMLLVVGNRLVQRRQVGIDQQVMMPGVGLHDT